MLDKKKMNIDIRDYWQMFLKKKFYFIIPVILSLIIGIILGLTMKPEYQSSTVVQISQNQILSSAMKRLVPGMTGPEQLQNLRKLITSYDYLKRLIKTLNLDTSPDMLEKAEKEKDSYPGYSKEEIVELLWIDLLRRFLVIKTIGTDFIQIIASAGTPDLALNLVQTLTQIFIDESLRREVGGIRGALEFSSEQLAIYEKRLKESEERLQRFKEGILSDQFENKSALSSNFDQVNALLSATDFELREAKDRLSFLDSRIKSLGVEYRSPNTNALIGLKKQMVDAVFELSKLMLQYSWQDVKVLKTNAEIDDLQDKIRREIESEIKLKYPDQEKSNSDMVVQKEISRMDIDLLERKREIFNNLLNFYKAGVSKGPERETSLNRLEREVAANREIYQTLLQQTRGGEIEEALQKTTAEFKFKIVEPAIKPTKPVKPDRVKIIMMAFVVGAMIGIGIIALLESIDHSFKNVESVEEYLKLPVLGTIPKIEKEIGNKWT